MRVLRSLLRVGACALVGVIALAATISVEAANGYYNGLKLPYAAGLGRVVVRSTGHGPGRHAVDFGMFYEDVLAMYSGRVVAVAVDALTGGKFIIVDHGDNYCALYLHLDKFYVLVGKSVQQGEKIALSGNTGQSTGPHLHAAVYRKSGGACGAAGAGNEVMMLFDEHPRAELQAGDWVTSANGRPIAPYYPSLDSVASHSLLVKWNDYADNEKGFKVERRDNKNGWTEIATLGENAISYLSDGLAPTTQYCFRVRSFNEAGASAYSNPVCAATKADEPSQLVVASAHNPIAPSAPLVTTIAASLSADETTSTPAGAALVYNAFVSLRLLLEQAGIASVTDGDD